MAQKDNLFAIDFDAILAAISEANAALFKRCDDLILAHTRFPGSLKTDDEIKRAKKYADMINEKLRECRQSRLSDAKPFRVLLSKIDEIFKSYEKKLNYIKSDISHSIILAVKVTHNSPPDYEKNQIVNQNSTENVKNEVIVNLKTGEVSAEINKKLVINEGLEVKWEVVQFDRNSIDLEALRPFLSDDAIIRAAAKHMKTFGPHQLKGVEYQQMVKL